MFDIQYSILKIGIGRYSLLMLEGAPPTGAYVRIPGCGRMRFDNRRGNLKLSHRKLKLVADRSLRQLL